MVDERRTTDHGYTISSPISLKAPKGSGELKSLVIMLKTDFFHIIMVSTVLCILHT